MTAKVKNIVIRQGETYSLVARWGKKPFVRKPISAISLTHGAPRLTVTGHELPNGWPCAVTLVKGMPQINATSSPPSDRDYHKGLLIDTDTIELNEVSPYGDNGAEWPAYTTGGFIQYLTPIDLAGYSARMKIKDRVGGTILASTETGDTPNNVLTIAIDNTEKTVSVGILPSATDDFVWSRGVYDLEMVSPTGVVTCILSGTVTVQKEVTTG